MKQSLFTGNAGNLERRDFLKGLFAAGSLVATSRLGAAADEQVMPPFHRKSSRSYISLGYQHIQIGLKQPFSILHISDTHLTATTPDDPPDKAAFAAQRRDGFGGRQELALANSLEWAKLNADYVLHTGDLIDFQTAGNLELVRKYYGEGDGTRFGALGNHEYQRRVKGEKPQSTLAYNDLSRKDLSAAYPFDIDMQSTVANGVNFVTMSQVYGLVSEKQVEQFRTERAKGLPIVICMHAPFYTPHIWRAHEKVWRGGGKKFRQTAVPPMRGDYQRQEEDPVTRAFLADLRREPLLKGILAGHLHFDVQDRFSPTAMEYVVGGNFLFRGQEIMFT